MKYIFNKYIFSIVFLIILGMILWINHEEGLIKLENNHIVMFKTENISCGGNHNPNSICEITLFNGSVLKLRAGENLLLNQFDMRKVNFVNYTSLIILIIGLFINHYYFNKK